MDAPLTNQLINTLPIMNNNQLINTLPLTNNNELTDNINNSALQNTMSSENITNDTNELNELNPYFVDFKENIRQWIKMDDDIITLNNALKEVKKKKADLTILIISFMENNNLKHLNTNDGKLQYSKSTTTKALNKNMLIEKLSLFLKDDNKGNSAADFVLLNREKTEKVTLKRSIKK